MIDLLRFVSGLAADLVRRHGELVAENARLTMRSLALLLFSLARTTAPVTGRRELTLVGEGTINQLAAQT